MTPDELKRRTQDFGLRVIRLAGALPRDRTADVIARQLLKAGTAVGANYRAACRPRTDGDFLARMGIVEEEADESAYWMELLVSARLAKSELVDPLLSECQEILRIVVASINTVKRRVASRRANPKSEIRNPK